VQRPSQTYLLTLDRQEYEALTRAIMLESNKVVKLQGFGRCLSSWLTEWNEGKYGTIMVDNHPPNKLTKLRNGYQIYVALNPESTKLLKSLRDQLGTQLDQLPTVRTAVTRIIDCIICESLSENTCAKP
jgi:hypothetical protein